MEKRVLAVDFGASGGRVMMGTFDGNRIGMKELHRFSNDPVMLNNTMYWDFLRLFFEIKQGLLKSKAEGAVSSMGIDTWGVDFGLLDRRGCLLENPVHYRDGRTAGMLEKSFRKMDKEQFYHITGNQFMEINTAFQLLSLLENRPELMDRADAMLLMPDLFNYYLCGVKCSEYSIASTTQLLDARSGEWSEEVAGALGIPSRLLQPIVPSATRLGALNASVTGELGLGSLDVVAVAGHDTQSAMAAVPAKGEDFIFLSCGTWSLFGTELASPVIDDLSSRYNITNEGGYGGRTSFLKNIIGLWLIQESRRQWIREGSEYGFGELEKMAEKAAPFSCLIDPDAPEFVPSGDVPARIRRFCRETGQRVPETIGEVIRSIDESLAMKYRVAFEEIKQCTKKECQAIHIVGGGAQSALLCQMTADACGCPVVAGPVEATVLGNIALQLISAGEVDHLEDVRRIIAESESVKTYLPREKEQWDAAFAAFRENVLGKSTEKK